MTQTQYVVLGGNGGNRRSKYYHKVHEHLTKGKRVVQSPKCNGSTWLQGTDLIADDPIDGFVPCPTCFGPFDVEARNA